MSYVNMAVNEDFISIISDGQVTKDDKVNVIKDDFKKIFKSQNFVVGITGNYDTAVELFSELERSFYNFNAAVGIVVAIMNKYHGKRDEYGVVIKNHICIAGYPKGKLKAIVFHDTPGETYFKSVQSPLDVSLDPEDIDFDPGQFFKKNVILKENGAFILENIQNAQKLTLLKVAAQSKTVNNHIFQEVLYNGKRK
jgi:hypothetical protein